MTGYVGIFWGIPGPDRSWAILTDATLLAQAELYGDFLTHPRGHYDVWAEWQSPRGAPDADRSNVKAILEQEYETFPRGRIVYHSKDRRFILYADRRLQQPHTIAAIASKFRLIAGTFDVRSDEHYRS
jgi:hypothetical protein